MGGVVSPQTVVKRENEDGTSVSVHNPRYETENTNIKLRYERDEEQIGDEDDIEVADNHVDDDD